VIPTSGRAFNRPAERPKDGRLNADERPAKTRTAIRGPRGIRSRGGRPPDAHHGEPKAKEAEPPDGERRPYAESEELRRFFGSAQPTEESGSAPGRGSPDRANAHKHVLDVAVAARPGARNGRRF